MLKVKQFRYGADNLGYLVYGTGNGMAVDGGAADGILSFIGEHHLTLKYVANTHDHQDHTSGNNALLAATNARLLSGADLPDGGRIALDGGKIRIIHTPGHTEESRSFQVDKFLLGGDTLFNGTIGNCFSGDLEGFYHSIRKLMELPDETVVYAGHDYVKASMAFARRLEPGNRAIGAFLRVTIRSTSSPRWPLRERSTPTSVSTIRLSWTCWRSCAFLAKRSGNAGTL
jgi:hydroxyacylglutathione hydrolase